GGMKGHIQSLRKCATTVEIVNGVHKFPLQDIDEAEVPVAGDQPVRVLGGLGERNCLACERNGAAEFTEFGKRETELRTRQGGDRHRWRTVPGPKLRRAFVVCDRAPQVPEVAVELTKDKVDMGSLLTVIGAQEQRPFPVL